MKLPFSCKSRVSYQFLFSVMMEETSKRLQSSDKIAMETQEFTVSPVASPSSRPKNVMHSTERLVKTTFQSGSDGAFYDSSHIYSPQNYLQLAE